MIVDRFFQEYIDMVRDDIEDQKNALVRADNFETVKHLQGQIEGMKKALKYLEAAIEKQQNN